MNTAVCLLKVRLHAAIVGYDSYFGQRVRIYPLRLTILGVSELSLYSLLFDFGVWEIADANIRHCLKVQVVIWNATYLHGL